MCPNRFCNYAGRPTVTPQSVPPNSDKTKSQKEITKYANVEKCFLSRYYRAMRNAPDPKQVVRVVLESIEMTLVKELISLDIL